MKRKLLFLPVIVTLYISIIWQVAFASTPPEKNNRSAQVLTILLAKEANIQPLDKKSQYKLTLKGVNPKIIYFSDRPQRLSGHIATQQYINKWEHGIFLKNSPNAMIEIIDLSKNPESLGVKNFTIELRHPIYSANDHGTLTFTILPIGNNKSLPLIKQSDYVALFIDDVCLSCIG
jgi:hypothetical protein